MEKDARSRLIEELTLVLLYLTSFTEKENPEIRFAWKSHDWDAMDSLVDDGYMYAPKCRRTHSRQLTEEGIEKAKTLLEQLTPALGFSKDKID